MRMLLLLLGFAVAFQATATSSRHVEGVLIYGKLDAVSTNDLHEAVAAAKSDMSDRLTALEVIDSNEIHVHQRQADLGWISEHRTTGCGCKDHDHPIWLLEASDIRANAEALRLIRSADEIYVFPIAVPLRPHRDNKHLRLLGPAASTSLVQLLGDSEDWCNCFRMRLASKGREPGNVGFVFRHGSDQLVLFFPSDEEGEGNFNGGSIYGGLEPAPAHGMIEWKRKYALPELSAKSG